MSPIALILAFPLLGFLINGLLGPKLPKSIVGWLGTIAVFSSFILAVSQWALISTDATGINWNAYTFLQIEQLTLNVSFVIMDDTHHHRYRFVNTLIFHFLYGSR